MEMKHQLNKYELVVDYFTEIEGKVFPIWHKGSFFAKNERDLKFLLRYLNIEYKEICVVIEEIDASDLGGFLGELANKFDPREN